MVNKPSPKRTPRRAHRPARSSAPVRAKRSALRRILRPIGGDSHRRAAVDIHHYLRNLILANSLPPDTVLSQVEVARCLEVSRTPVREALRMLQEEGLVGAEPNYRCRVLGFNPQELEALYVSRIANESISAAVTVQAMEEGDIARLAEALQELRKAEGQQNFSRWIKHHRTFHQLLFAGANPMLQQRMYVDCQRSERYIYNARQAGRTDLFRRAALEHEEIFQACRRREADLVVSMLTNHLARASIDILAELAPLWEPATLRSAVRIILSGAAELKKPAGAGRGAATLRAAAIKAAE